jgi:hypothetical protein
LIEKIHHPDDRLQREHRVLQVHFLQRRYRMKFVTNRRWLAVMTLTAVSVMVGVCLRLSVAAPPQGESDPFQTDPTAEGSAVPGAQQGAALSGALYSTPASSPKAAADQPAQGNRALGMPARLPGPGLGVPNDPGYRFALDDPHLGPLVERQTLVAQDADTRRLIAAYHQTEDENERARIVKELPILVAKQFDARQQVREQELRQLEGQLRKLQELHLRRAKQRDQIVEERVRQLLRDADGLGWGSDEEQPAGYNFNAFGPPGGLVPNPSRSTPLGGKTEIGP